MRGTWILGRPIAVMRVYGRKYGYVPTYTKSKALEWIRRTALKEAFNSTMKQLTTMTEKERK